MDYIFISDIKVGDRTRKEMGDVGSLAESLKQVGWLQPVLLDGGNNLIAGLRRIRAAERNGWDKVPFVAVEKLKDAAHYLKAERDENTFHKPFTKSELGEMALKLLALEGRKADERQKSSRAKPGNKVGGHKGAQGGGTVPPPSKQAGNGKSREIVGDALGVSGQTAERSAAVVEAAKQDPDSFGDLREKMDADGVKPAYQELKRRQAEAVPETPADTLRRVNAEIESFCRGLMKYVEEKLPSDYWINDMNRREGAARKFRDGCETLRSCKCAGLCPKCDGADPKCRHCRGTGRLPKLNLDMI